jgi:hypothetical protein
VIQVRLQAGKPILEDGKVGTEEACCCEECCTCDSGFSFYANGRILDGWNFSGTGLGLQFTPIIPGLGFENGSWTNSGCASNAACDDDGNLIVRINISQRGQSFIGEGEYIQGGVIESRYYKFDLSGGGCGVITGEPIALPENASSAADAFECDNSSPGVEGVVDGDVIRYVFDLTDGSDADPDTLDSSPLHLDWSSIVIQASCQIECGGITLGASGFQSASCETIDLDCVNENCECQLVPDGVSGGVVPGECYNPFGDCWFHCLLNPLP